jgi:hypothetical protein
LFAARLIYSILGITWITVAVAISALSLCLLKNSGRKIEKVVWAYFGGAESKTPQWPPGAEPTNPQWLQTSLRPENKQRDSVLWV